MTVVDALPGGGGGGGGGGGVDVRGGLLGADEPPEPDPHAASSNASTGPATRAYSGHRFVTA